MSDYSSRQIETQSFAKTEFSARQRNMISKACRIADVNYPEFIQTKEWMLELAEVAQEMTDENIRLGEDPDHLHEITTVRIDRADSEVPYLTYRLWLIWTDLQLYREWPDIRVDYGFELRGEDLDNIEKIPQLACYEIALKVLTGWE